MQDAGDPVIANAQEALSVSRPKISAGIEAVRSCNSGATAPAATVDHMLWADTTADIVKQRTAADDAWRNLWPENAGPVSAVSYPKVAGDSPVTVDQPGIYLCDCTAGAISVVLPDAATSKGWSVQVVKTDASGNAASVDRAGSDTIQGATAISLASQYDKGFVYSAGGAVWLKWPGSL